MQPNAPYSPPSAPAPTPQPHEYEFITNPGEPSKRGFNPLPGGTSLPIRIAIVGGGLLVLLVLFIVIKGLLSGGGNTEALTTVAQDQQQIIHLLTTADEQEGANLSASNQAFAATAAASLTSAQDQLVTYLADNGHKVGDKTLGLKVSATLDEQLKTAATNSTYNDTFKETMQTQLKDYQQALREAYKQTTGPKGKKLLGDQFKGSELLLQQLNEPSV
jgi:hypothetical protein